MLPTLGGSVTCAYGVRGPWAAGYHPGIDFRAHYDPIRASTHGKVIFAGYHGGYGTDYGNHIIVACGVRRILYAHMSKFYVRAGNYVNAGQALGVSGNTGRTTGPHLHYEERVRYFTYWDHRRPIFPYLRPWSVSDLHDSAMREPGTTKSRHPDQVLSYAKALKAIGLLAPRYVTGHFSYAKKAAVKKWQRRCGVKQTGIPDLVSTRMLGTHILNPVKR